MIRPRRRKTRTSEPPRGKGAAARRGAAPQAEVPHGAVAYTLWADAVARSLERGEPCSVAVIDVDGFAGHVDALDPTRADAIVAEVARRTREVLSDEALLGVAAGDQLALALPAVEVEAALGLLERVREAIAQTPIVVGRGPHRRRCTVTVSTGLAGLRRDGADLPALLDQARGALWRAKSLGGNRAGLPAREKMVMKTSYYPQRQLEQLKRLATRLGVPEAVLLRRALDGILLEHKARPPRPDL